jgi:uncharacterized protein YukE
MVSLSGLTSIRADKLTIRKPAPSLQSQDIFDCFIRDPEGYSRYNSADRAWIPLDNEHVGGISDTVGHLEDVSGDLAQQIQSLQTQITQLQSQYAELRAELTALEARVQGDEDNTSGFGAQIQSILGWISTVGNVIYQIEQALIRAGLL